MRICRRWPELLHEEVEGEDRAVEVLRLEEVVGLLRAPPVGRGEVVLPSFLRNVR
jgi:hypothetical protein